MLLQEIFFFTLGLVFGSFVSALSWRYPKRISVVKGRSFCPKCKKQINWYDNIPLLSFLLLGGKCRNCKNLISIRYPVIELTTAVGFLFIFTLQGLSVQAVYSIVIFLILETIFIIDFENRIIPDDFVFIGIVLTFLYSIFFVPEVLLSLLLAGFLSALFLLLIHLFTKSKGMGLGDVKFAVLGGMIVGLRLSPIWLFVAFLTGAIVGIILILGRRAGLKSKIAFGPFLVAAIPITLIFGEAILKLII